MICKSQQLGVANSNTAARIREDLFCRVDCIDVVGGDDNLAFAEILHHYLKTLEVVVGSFLEAVNDGVLSPIFFCDFGFLHQISSTD